MCELVDISDDENSMMPEDDVGIKPKDEVLDYDLPLQNTYSSREAGNVASSSGTNVRSSFIGMGFAPSLVDKAIEEKGEGNAELLLEALFAYSDLQQPKTEPFDDDLFSRGNNGLAVNVHDRETLRKSDSSDSLDDLFAEDTNGSSYLDGPLKEEPDAQIGVHDSKMASLLKMNFSLDEARYAMDRLGKDSSIDQLMDFIIAARMAKKYEKHSDNPVHGDNDDSNEALFGIMDKTLRLLEMGFSEHEISAAFEKCGSEVPLPELANFIIAAQLAGADPNDFEYSSSTLSTSNSLANYRSSNHYPFDSTVRTKNKYSTNSAPRHEFSDFLESLNGKKPKREITTYEPIYFKKPKVENTEDSTNSHSRTNQNLRRGYNTPSSSTQASPSPSPSRTLTPYMGPTKEEEDEKLSIFANTPRPNHTLTSVVAKPPYFFYGNVTKLSADAWAKISTYCYSIPPEFVKTEQYSALVRREGYVHNLPTENRSRILSKGPITIQEAIPNTRKWWPKWDTRTKLVHISCETNGTLTTCDRIGRIVSESRGNPSPGLQEDLIRQCEDSSLVWTGHYRLGQIQPEDLERIMGYPTNHTRAVGFPLDQRLRSLKLSFQTDTLAYHLSVLKHLFPGGLTVFSFFNGIGGVLIALHRLGIRLKAVVSVEKCEIKRKIVKQWWDNTGQRGELIQVGDSHKLSSNKLEDMVTKFGGIDFVACQNPYAEGDSDDLARMDFSLFAEFLRVLQRIRSTMERNG